MAMPVAKGSTVTEPSSASPARRKASAARRFVKRARRDEPAACALFRVQTKCHWLNIQTCKLGLAAACPSTGARMVLDVGLSCCRAGEASHMYQVYDSDYYLLALSSDSKADLCLAVTLG